MSAGNVGNRSFERITKEVRPTPRNNTIYFWEVTFFFFAKPLAVGFAFPFVFATASCTTSQDNMLTGKEL